MAGEKPKREKTKKLRKYMFVLGYLGLTVLLGTVIYALPVLSDALTSTWIVEYGSLQVTDEETCYVVRSEDVVVAPASGSVNYNVGEGEMVRKGTRILDVGSGGSVCNAAGNGIVSYYIDGLESVFTPEAMESLTKSDVEGIALEGENRKTSSVEKGDPLYKLVGGDEWFLMYWIKEGDITKYEEGSRVTVQLPLSDLRGSVYKIQDEGKEYRIILRLNRYYADVAKVRVFRDATIVTSDYEGLLLRNESIVSQDGQTGVYVKDLNGDYSFTPVSVIKSDGEYSLVRSGSFTRERADGKLEEVLTIQAYDEILNSPK